MPRGLGIALGAQADAAPHRPVAVEGPQAQRHNSHARPPLVQVVGGARARIVRAHDRIVVLLDLVVLGTVVEEGLDAAQARRVIDDCLAATQTRIAANPLGGQLPRTLALLAPAPLARWTGDGIADVVALMVGHRRRRGIRAKCIAETAVLDERHGLLDYHAARGRAVAADARIRDFAATLDDAWNC